MVLDNDAMRTDLDYERPELKTGLHVKIRRGNQRRGPETGPGFGREVSAIIVGFGDEAQGEVAGVKCMLLSDDCGAVARPQRRGETGMWPYSQIITE